jgi:superfamily II DNA or RNA helicase
VNHSEVAFTLKHDQYLGLIPECVVLSINDLGIPEINYHKISSDNHKLFSHCFDNEDTVLVNCCLRWEKDVLLSKIEDKQVKNWEQLVNKYFVQAKTDASLHSKRHYILSYIDQYLNKFYEHLGDKPLYMPEGKLPSLWQRLFFEEEHPEVFYHFNYLNKEIDYYLKAYCESHELNLSGARLLTKEPARILIGNRIFQFDREINGMKLTPFFSKKTVHIAPAHTEAYLQKFVAPLIIGDRVIANGFNIENVASEANPLLELTTLGTTIQSSIFEAAVQSTEDRQYMQIKLYFEYGTFKFQCGLKSNRVQINQDTDNVTFFKVERNKQQEKYISDRLKDLGLDVNGRTENLVFDDAIDWVNKHFDGLQKLGIEVRQNYKIETEKHYFIGSYEISLNIHEGRDWFEIEGEACIGSYKFGLPLIIKLIRHNKQEFLLPNGEYAKIPQSWIDEYGTLSQFSVNEKDKLCIAKHHVTLLHELNKKGSVGLTLSDKLEKLLGAGQVADYALPETFIGTLRPYQKAGYNWLRFLDELALGGCLADDMGLGKTIQTLCLLQWMKEQNRGVSLLVVPKSILYNWQLEASRFCPNLKVQIHSGTSRTQVDTELAKFDVIITSYAILRRDTLLFQSIHFNYVILDEAQFVKNPSSGIAQACWQLQANRYLTLTGTPIENSIIDLWSQMHFTNRNMLGSRQWFEKEFIGNAKILQLQAIVKPFILRRLKGTVAQDLPEKFVHVQFCDMNPAQLEQYRTIKNHYRSLILENVETENVGPTKFNLLEGLLRMRQVANHPQLINPEYKLGSGKFDTVCELLDAIVKEGNKILIFSSFVEHLKLYKDYLDEQSISYCYLDGSTKDRDGQVNLFQNDDNYPVFLLSLKAGGVGLNLTRAEYVFLLDPWWNPAVESQAFDRAHRIGQKNSVFVYKFITRNTIEEKILELQASKRNLAEALITAEEGFFKSLDKKEIEFLLQ